MGLAVIYSGLDWSGSSDHESSVYYALVHIDGEEIARLNAALLAAKKRLRVPETSVFRHVSCSHAAHKAFYDELANVPFTARLLVVPPVPRNQPIRGHEEIRAAVTQLVLDCPNTYVARQKLYIDLERRDMKQLRELRTRVRKELTTTGRKTFENIQPCPDHRIEGGIVQVADMLAGEFREHGGIYGPFLPLFQSRLRVI